MAVIIDPPTPPERPILKIIRNEGVYHQAPRGDITPCQHPVFDLDERWSKVICDSCGSELAAFDILMRWAEFQEWQDRREARFHDAERSLLVEQLRRLQGLRCFTEEERATVKRMIWAPHRGGPPTELREEVRRLERLELDRRMTRRQERRG